MARKITLLACLAACMILIFVFSSQNADISGNLSEGITYRIACLTVKDFADFSPERQKEIVEGMHFYIRKGAHFSEYALLGILAFLNANEYIKSTGRKFLAALPFCLVYASTDEFHQLFTDGRYGSPVDVMIDFSGSVTGTLVIYAFMLLIKRIRKDKSISA